MLKDTIGVIMEIEELSRIKLTPSPSSEERESFLLEDDG